MINGMSKTIRLFIALNLMVAFVTGCGSKSIDSSKKYQSKNIKVKEHPTFIGEPLYLVKEYGKIMIAYGASANRLRSTGRGNESYKLNNLTPSEGSNFFKTINTATVCSDGMFRYPCVVDLKGTLYNWEPARKENGEVEQGKYLVTFNMGRYKEYAARDLRKIGITDKVRGEIIRAVTHEITKYKRNMDALKKQEIPIAKEAIVVDKSGFLSLKEKAKYKKRFDSVDYREIALIDYVWDTNKKTMDNIRDITSMFSLKLKDRVDNYRYKLKKDTCKKFSNLGDDPFRISNTYYSTHDCIVSNDKKTGQPLRHTRLVFHSKYFTNLMPSNMLLSDGRITVKKHDMKLEIENNTDDFAEIKQVSLYYSRSDKGSSGIPYKLNWSQSYGSMSPQSVINISEEFSQLYYSISRNLRTYNLTLEQAKSTYLDMGFAIRYAIGGKEYTFYKKQKKSLLALIDAKR